MRRLFKWAFRLVLLLVILLVALVVCMDSIVRALAEREIRSATGMDVKIGSFSIGLVSPVITIENFKLYNTAVWRLAVRGPARIARGVRLAGALLQIGRAHV